MIRLARLFIVIALVLLGVGLATPGVRTRAWIVANKLSGASQRSWGEVAIEMVPHRWHGEARELLGESAEEWSRELHFPVELGSAPWKSYTVFFGPTPNLNFLDCHYSVLGEGRTPHPPHVHDEEELIIPIEGELEILRADAADSPNVRSERVAPGQIAYHSTRLPHTLRGAGPGPSGYVVLKWAAGGQTADGELQGRTFDFRAALAEEPASGEGWLRSLVLEGPTRALKRLHAHLSFARPGEGADPHRDPHDVMLVVLEGAVETTTGAAEAPALVFHPAGRKHFLRSAGDGPARYLALEFVERD